MESDSRSRLSDIEKSMLSIPVPYSFTNAFISSSKTKWLIYIIFFLTFFAKLLLPLLNGKTGRSPVRPCCLFYLFYFTVILIFFDLEPDFTVMVAVPFFLAFITPFFVTVATFLLEVV